MKPDLEKYRIQLFIFLICLLISLFLWLLVRLSKDYYYTVGYGLRYTQIPENLRLVRSSDKILILKMKVQGFDLFSERYIIPHDQVADIPLKGIKVKPDGRYLTGWMLTQPIGKDIAYQTNNNHELVSVFPDTLFFSFEKVSQFRQNPDKKKRL